MQETSRFRGVTLALLAAGATAAFGQGQTVEQVAQTIAAQHNATSVPSKDGMVASSSARAAGKNVVFEYVLRVRKNLSATEINEFAESARSEAVPKTCQVPGNHIGFDRGMSYTFIYKSQYGKTLTEFSVDKATCARLK